MAAGHSKTLAAKAPPVAHVRGLIALKFFVPLPRMKVRKRFCMGLLFVKDASHDGQT
jgi:hypothetical protein